MRDLREALTRFRRLAVEGEAALDPELVERHFLGSGEDGDCGEEAERHSVSRQVDGQRRAAGGGEVGLPPIRRHTRVGKNTVHQPEQAIVLAPRQRLAMQTRHHRVRQRVPVGEEGAQTSRIEDERKEVLRLRLRRRLEHHAPEDSPRRSVRAHDVRLHGEHGQRIGLLLHHHAA